MDVEIGVQGITSGDELRELRSWLVGENDLRGRLRLLEREPGPGELGGSVDVLLAVLAPGGTAVALASGLMAWLRARTSDVRVLARRPDGAQIEIEARRIGQVSASQLPAAVQALSVWLEGTAMDPTLERSLRPADQRRQSQVDREATAGG